jgi:hypothetical protein
MPVPPPVTTTVRSANALPDIVPPWWTDGLSVRFATLAGGTRTKLE